MKLSNFEVLTRVRHSEIYTLESIFANVDVETDKGLLWWRKKEVKRRVIHKPFDSTIWRFVDTGKFTPGYQAEELYAAYCSQQEFDRRTCCGK